MPRLVSRLSAKLVENKREPGYYCDGDGLYLQVSRSLTKSWILRYTRFGKTREMGLGSTRNFSLAEARERAGAFRKVLAEGRDPIEVRDEQFAAQRAKSFNTVTFAECARRFIAAHRAGWRSDKHVAQWETTLESYAEPINGLPVDRIDTPAILRVIEPIWTKKPETANRVRGRIERVLDWAKARMYRAGENPARWRGHLDKLLPARSKVQRVKHLEALPYSEIGAFMEDLRKQPGVAARALELTILTAARSGEVRGAKPAEFDLDNSLWIVPAERMKAGKEHRVPLTPRAVELVKTQLEEFPDSAYLFPNSRNGEALSDMALLSVLKRMDRKGITCHGFRSTFKDWAAETTAYANELTEMALAHSIASEVEAAYRRGDMFEKRRRLMNDWAKYCDTSRSGAKVTPIRQRVHKGEMHNPAFSHGHSGRGAAPSGEPANQAGDEGTPVTASLAKPV